MVSGRGCSSRPTRRVALAAGSARARAGRRTGRPRSPPRRGAGSRARRRPGAPGRRSTRRRRIRRSPRGRSPGRPREAGVDEPPAERGVDDRARTALERRLRLQHREGSARHRLDAAGHEDVAVADGDGVGRGVDRLEAAAAEPVDREPADLDREARQKERHPGDIAVVLARPVRAAEDHVLDQPPGRSRSVPRSRASDDRREVVGANGGQGAAVAPDGRPDRIDDPGFAERAPEITSHGPIVAREPSGRARRPRATPTPASPAPPPPSLAARLVAALGVGPARVRWVGPTVPPAPSTSAAPAGDA